ncbi:coenzyme A transporter [Rhodotorula paludigena]|uniref:coenzyme A transporter n=1 Tax=Rhodotorula paludigena TaxID=86838 RepID=UPI003175C1CC
MQAASPAASTSSVRIEDSAPASAARLAPPPSPTSPDAPAHAQQQHSPRKRRRTDRDSLQYALTSGFAGGIAGCVAKTSVAPLDRVKILFQTRSPDYQKYAGTWLGVFRASRDIYAETGIRGLLQGHSATLLRIFPYAAIKFMAYDHLETTLMPTPETETPGRRFLAGAIAGTITTGITYPLELIRVRLAFESHHSAKDRASLLRTIRQIYESPPPVAQSASPSASSAASSSSSIPASTASTAVKPSIAHFYRGVGPTLVGIIPYAGTSFLMWGFLKHDFLPTYLSPTFRRQNRAMLDLLAGGVAGAIGQTTAYPLDIVRRRMQVGPVLHADGRGRAGFWETAGGVWRTQGWRGFFVGLSIGYLKVVPMNAVSFATWVAMKRMLGLEETPSREKRRREQE